MGKRMCNNPKLDLVNMNAYIKFGESLSICSQGMEGTKFRRKSSAKTLVQIWEKRCVTIPC